MSPLQAIILGLVEGITEYLPVSSTGHLIIASSLMGLDTPGEKSAVDAFNIVIQGGAILAVVGLYWPRIVQMLRGLFGKDPAGLRLMINLIVAFLPAVVIGLLLHDLIEEHLFNMWTVLAALALGGVWMIWLDRWRAKRIEAGHAAETTLTIDDLDWKRALGIGFFQVVAMWPGTSRSMMTIAGGTLLGLKPKEAAEFSFLLGLPTLGGACVYKLYRNLRESRDAGEPNMFEVLGLLPVLLGMAVAAIAAAFAVKWLVAFLNRHGLAPFGWYRLVLCAVLAGLIFTGFVTIN